MRIERRQPAPRWQGGCREPQAGNVDGHRARHPNLVLKMRRKDSRCQVALHNTQSLKPFLHSWTTTASLELVLTLGYRNGANRDRGLRRLNLWLENGEGYDRILKQISAVYPGHAEALEKALQETANLRAAEAEAVFLEQCKAEEDAFRPYLHADGEKMAPNGITIFGISGGHQTWTTIQIQKAILALPLEEQLVMLPELMREYRRKYNGACPFFGKVTGFKHVRCLDYFQFDQDGGNIEHIEKPFRTGYVEVSLR